MVVPRTVRIGLTGRLFLLVILAVVPALVFQAWNEYDQRIAREDDIRQHVIEITRQFGEEIGVLREVYHLPAVGRVDPVISYGKSRLSHSSCEERRICYRKERGRLTRTKHSTINICCSQQAIIRKSRFQL